jgi:hypothetical protein
MPIISPAPPPPPPPPSPPPAPPSAPPKLQQLPSVTSPVFLTSPPGEPTRLFVVEQPGRVRIIQNDALVTVPFLDISASTKISAGGERGLLSMAFHPQYATNGRFYVYFTNPAGDLRIVRYNVSADANVADEATADTLLKIPHPVNANHNGGQLQFGPDGKLYAATGDGGSGGDPPNNAQNKLVLLGKLLRLDVDGPSGYAVPTDNPFVGDASAAPEIWAYGLRNPWRFSFDKQTGALYIADVGQGAWEEVDVAPAPGSGKGANYGWRVMEGTHCYNPSSGCNQTGLILPIIEYGHTGSPTACSITGGYVYRGTRVPALAGHYLYADFCQGFVKSFQFSGGTATNQTDWTTQLSPGNNISSFGEDARGDVYIMSLTGGLYRIVEAP